MASGALPPMLTPCLTASSLLSNLCQIQVPEISGKYMSQIFLGHRFLFLSIDVDMDLGKWIFWKLICITASSLLSNLCPRYKSQKYLMGNLCPRFFSDIDFSTFLWIHGDVIQNGCFENRYQKLFLDLVSETFTGSDVRWKC